QPRGAGVVVRASTRVGACVTLTTTSRGVARRSEERGAAMSGQLSAGRRRTTAALGVALAALAFSPVAAQAAETTVVSVTMIPSEADITTGFLDLTLEIALRSDSALPDELWY